MIIGIACGLDNTETILENFKLRELQAWRDSSLKRYDILFSCAVVCSCLRSARVSESVIIETRLIVVFVYFSLRSQHQATAYRFGNIFR